MMQPRNVKDGLQLSRARISNKSKMLAGYFTRPHLSRSGESQSLMRTCLSCLFVLFPLQHKCSTAILYPSQCCPMPSPIPQPRIGSKSGLLRLVSATVGKSSGAADIGSGHISMRHRHQLESNLSVCVVYVSVCLSTSQPT